MQAYHRPSDVFTSQLPVIRMSFDCSYFMWFVHMYPWLSLLYQIHYTVLSYKSICRYVETRSLHQ